MSKTNEKIQFKKYSQSFKKAQACLQTSAQWLDAFRISGEEHYLCLLFHATELSQNEVADYRNDRTKLWRERLKKAAIEYMTGQENDAPICNPTHMAMIRHQLDKGFEGITYKKSTEYTGPAVCLVKFKDEKEDASKTYTDWVEKRTQTEQLYHCLLTLSEQKKAEVAADIAFPNIMKEWKSLWI